MMEIAETLFKILLVGTAAFAASIAWIFWKKHLGATP